MIACMWSARRVFNVESCYTNHLLLQFRFIGEGILMQLTVYIDDVTKTLELPEIVGVQIDTAGDMTETELLTQL